jgi:glycosyltransferase involved in cell wall biosynthesis
MHVVLVHFYSSTPTPAYQEIAAALRTFGHTVWVGTPNEDGDLCWCDGDCLVAVVRGPAPGPGALICVPVVGSILKRILFLGFILRLRKFLREGRPDIVQVNPASVFWLGLLPLFMPSQMRFILDFRQVGQRGAIGLVGSLKGWLASWRRQVCSRFIYDRACFLHLAGAKKTLGRSWFKWGVVVPLGTDPRFLLLDRKDRASERNAMQVRFLYVGTLSRGRHLEQILFAVHRMLSVTDRFRVVFLGPDTAERFYHDLVDELELGSVVTIKPSMPYEDIPREMASYDVALAYVPDRPAHWHYHPTLKVLEYRALGMPMIASDNEPNRDVVENGVNGLLVQNSIESLAEAMLRFVIDRDFLQRCERNARAMRLGTTWSEVAEMYQQNVYLALRSEK